jgi:sugar fermentation stimulation protein A
MKFASPLVSGHLVARYKRFLADVDLANGERITASCPNTGAMLGLTTPGAIVWLSTSDSPTRKYRHTWEMIEVPGEAPSPATHVGINTAHPNAIVAEAILNGAMPELAGYAGLRREVKYGQNSRVDILLEGAGKPACYVEIKNVHLLRTSGLAEFPDSRTARGLKHLGELSGMVRSGCRAVMVYLVQRADAVAFSLAADIDPAYAAAAASARACGVEMLAYGCELSPAAISLAKPLPIRA